VAELVYAMANNRILETAISLAVSEPIPDVVTGSIPVLTTKKEVR